MSTKEKPDTSTHAAEQIQRAHALLSEWTQLQTEYDSLRPQAGEGAVDARIKAITVRQREMNDEITAMALVVRGQVH